jgi:hypothetical protein
MPREIKYTSDKIVGMSFGRLTILENIGTIKRKRWVKVKCKCGNQYEVRLDILLSGSSNSCGCLQKEITSKRMLTHGLSKHPLRGVHRAMVNRCHEETDPHYDSYGAKGVVVCEEWRNSYEAFANWALENGWKKGLQIDKDKLSKEKPGKQYGPDFCCFLTCKENSQYKSDNRMIIYNGETLSLSQWADRFNVKYNTFRDRIEKGWSMEKMATDYHTDGRTNKLEYKGELIGITELTKRFNISLPGLKKRLKKGWSVEKALETPVETKFFNKRKLVA